MLHGTSPNQGVFELFEDGFVNLVAEILDRSVLCVQNYRSRIVRKLSFWLGVYPREIEISPHSFKEFVHIPFVVRRNGDGMRNLADNFQFLNSHSIYFIE